VSEPVSAAPVTEPASVDLSTAEASDDLVEQIREIWQEVLGIERVEVDDDLFDLGGHSLTVTRIIARMRERLGLELEIDDFFDYPTIAGALHVVNAR
jgi:acyl carrier protein